MCCTNTTTGTELPEPLFLAETSCTSVEEHVSHNSHLGEDLEGVATEHQALDDNPVGVHGEQGARGNEVVHSCQAESPMHQGRCLHHPFPTTNPFPKAAGTEQPHSRDRQVTTGMEMSSSQTAGR